MKKIASALFVVATLASCMKEYEIKDENSFGNGVCASATDFIMEDATKVALSQSGDGVPTFAWKEGDAIGIVPMDNETFQSNYRIKEIGENPKLASFDGGAWSLKQGKTYAAYYPVKDEVATSGGHLTFSFLGQMQVGNNNLEHIGDYDYMYASSVSPSVGSARFAFNHLVSLLNISLDLPEGVYDRVMLEGVECWFAKSAQLSLADGVMSVATSSLSTEANLVLDNIRISSGTPLSVWISVLPTDALKGSALVFKAYSGTEDYSGVIEISTVFEAGKAYRYSAKPDEEDHVSMADWEYPLDDSFKSATSIEISVNQAKPESGFADLNREGTFWAIMSESILKLQTSKSAVKGHDCFPDFINASPI